MCRNIRTLFNFEPPATTDEVRASSIQFVRKVSGFTKPSKMNAEAFDKAIDDVAVIVQRLLDSGADVNLQAIDGGTALGAALAGGYTEIAIMLRRAGARQPSR